MKREKYLLFLYLSITSYSNLINAERKWATLGKSLYIRQEWELCTCTELLWQRARCNPHGLSVCVEHFNVLKNCIWRTKQLCVFVAALGWRWKSKWVIHETDQELTHKAPALCNVLTRLIFELKKKHTRHKQGCAPRRITGIPVTSSYKTWGAKDLSFVQKSKFF